MTSQTLASGLAGAIGSDFRQADNRLVFVEFGGLLSELRLAPGARVVSSGTATLRGTWLFDFDRGVEVAVDGTGAIHVAYQGADHDDVFYKNTMTNAQELVDDGYRIVGTTPDGLPKPEYHFVGSDTQVVLTGNGPMVVYQDATSHELLVADKSGAMGAWRPQALAGNETDWKGAYGFFASAALGTNQVTISTWVIDQQQGDNWVELFGIPVSPP